ncbi:hypothetical protein PGTUg99_023687 [Puccinia graminis f. sp. tritici]|uniref:Peptidase A2 domain-containing protein n=1 Tax=Puccinia graminis f. sp. tritici TaxID=56615 RepID=A0A5B0M9M7_PUCGR|nr:hypothetical protein PGTUg99_023687 [Puccinia graminis f. sp. tritici]
MSNSAEQSMEQSAMMLKQQAKMTELEDSMQQMKEMMMALLKQSKAPQAVPIPETPPPRGQSLRFATSTPYTGIAGMETTIGAGEESLLCLAVTSSESSQTRTKSEIKLSDEEKGVVLDTRKLNLDFDGSEVELFIKRVEKIASLHKAGGQDVALQLPFMIKDKKISECIENMEGHENRDWELLKKELIRKWGRATPLRRFNENSVSTLVSKHMDKGGIQTKEEYRTFIGELEEILAYLTKMDYEDVNATSGEPLWKAISTEMRRDVAKELAHDKKLKKTKEGKALVPKLEVLKDYVEASLSVYDLDVGITKTKPAIKESESKREVQAKTKADNGTDKMKALEEEIKKLRTEVNTNQNARPFPPHFSAPRQPSTGFRPPGPGGPSYQRPQLQCFYCKEMDHTSMFCQHLNEDITKRLVFKQGPNFYYSNREIIPTDTGESIRELVRKFSEKSNAANETGEKRANMMTSDEFPQPRQEPTASMISTNRWEAWSPPEMHYGEEDEENVIGFGLRRSARTNKEKEKEAQPPASKPETSGKSKESISKTPPGNQEVNKNPSAARKRRPSYPGAWMEGESDNESSEGDNAEAEKPVSQTPEKRAEEKSAKEVFPRTVDQSKVGGGLRKKFLKQSFTLTLEELLLIAPKFLQELQAEAEDNSSPLERSQNSGRCDHRNFDDSEPHRPREKGMKLGNNALTYACPLGFIEVWIAGQKIRALVDTGAEMNIMPETLAIQLKLPSREISMNIMGIGGHSTPIVGLAEGVHLCIDEEDEKAANFFIARGKVYTVLGRPFLADHKVRLELSKSRGEILSYELWDGGRLCIPICSPKIPGWEMAPPRRIADKCFSMTIDNYADFMDSSGEEDKELTRQEEGSGSTEAHDWDNTTLGSEGRSKASQDSGECNNEWSSNPSTWETEDHTAVTKTEQSEWTPFPEWEAFRCKGSYNLVTITADYVDHGYPVKEFLRMYPETYEYKAGGIWDELPGYTAGRIGFIMLLTTNGTKGYLENSYIWPEEWWFVDEERLAMYLGTKEGRMTIADQELWYSGRDREKEEEEFLTELIRQMVGIFGRFDWQAFKWVLRNEQARLGKDFETFWKDWEYAAIAD